MALGSTQPLTKMSTRNLFFFLTGDKVRPACRADNLAATACNRDIFTFYHGFSAVRKHLPLLHVSCSGEMRVVENHRVIVE
jgi:hypothetical protein